MGMPIRWPSTARIGATGPIRARSDILDAGAGAVLDSRNVTAFKQPPQYLVWNLKGHVTLKVTLTGGSNAVVSGLFFGPVSTCTARLRLRRQRGHQSVPDFCIAQAGPVEAIQRNGKRKHQYRGHLVVGRQRRDDSGGLYTAPSTVSTSSNGYGDRDEQRGHHEERECRRFVAASASDRTMGTSAQFIWADTNTQGNWQGVYGVDGYNVIGDVASYPSYATVTLPGRRPGYGPHRPPTCGDSKRNPWLTAGSRRLGMSAGRSTTISQST